MFDTTQYCIVFFGCQEDATVNPLYRADNISQPATILDLSKIIRLLVLTCPLVCVLCLLFVGMVQSFYCQPIKDSSLRMSSQGRKSHPSAWQYPLNGIPPHLALGTDGHSILDEPWILRWHLGSRWSEDTVGTQCCHFRPFTLSPEGLCVCQPFHMGLLSFDWNQCWSRNYQVCQCTVRHCRHHVPG